MYIYVTTDSYEARELIEEDNPPRHEYYDLDVETGLRLKTRISFNPMASIRVNSTATKKEIETIVKKLLCERLNVAVEN